MNKAEYTKYKLYRGDVYVGYVAIHRNSLSIIRTIFERTASFIRPQKSHYIEVIEPNGEHRDEGDYLAHFEIEAAYEDVLAVYPIEESDNV